MPKTPESTAGATEAVDYAMRTISEASQHGTAYVQRALKTIRAFFGRLWRIRGSTLIWI